MLVYDGQCAFCVYCVDYARAATNDAVDYQPYQSVQQNFPNISEAEFRAAIQLVYPDGRVASGAQAAFQALRLGKHSSLWDYLYSFMPLFGVFSEWSYRLVARHRNGVYRISRLFFGPSLQPTSLALTNGLFLRLLGLVYLCAFYSFYIQAQGLIGEAGILPATEYLAAVEARYGDEKYWVLPTLFWMNASAVAIDAAGLVGIGLSLLLLFNLLPRLCLPGLYLLYLSLFGAGQVFMSYQWDILLLECGFLAIFLPYSPRLFTWLYRWLLFRFMLQSGLVKLLSGDAAWANLTALNFHFETQPLPTALAWYMHKLPELILQAGVVFTFVVELLVPFLILMPRRPRLVAAVSIAVFELVILATGNYNFFNVLTLCLCVLLLDDQYIRRLLPAGLQQRIGARVQATARIRWTVLPASVAVYYLILSAILLGATGYRSALSPVSQSLLSGAAPFHIANGYGLFAVMTTRRPEIILEGSNDGETWQAYELPYKPGALDRPPVWATPHQPRLDWQLWFAALAPAEQNPWLKWLVYSLLTGSEPVLALFEHDPFKGVPPRYVRASLYQYHFSDRATRDETGQWWTRAYEREFLPPAGFKVEVSPAQWPGTQE